jgi:hypothetical protein
LLELHTTELTNEDLLELEKERQQEEDEYTANQPEPSARQLTAKRLAQAFVHISAAIVIFFNKTIQTWIAVSWWGGR